MALDILGSLVGSLSEKRISGTNSKGFLWLSYFGISNEQLNDLYDTVSAFICGGLNEFDGGLWVVVSHYLFDRGGEAYLRDENFRDTRLPCVEVDRYIISNMGFYLGAKRLHGGTNGVPRRSLPSQLGVAWE